MATNVITADDTLTLFDRVFNDFADGAVSMITFDNDIVGVKTGKNANTIFSKNETGNNAKMVLRIMRGSSDDKFLQDKLQQIEGDYAATVLASGEFVKRLGDGQGNVISDAYTLEGGTFTRKIDTMENVEGDTQQGVSVYNMIFAYATRSIR